MLGWGGKLCKRVCLTVQALRGGNLVCPRHVGFEPMSLEEPRAAARATKTLQGE